MLVDVVGVSVHATDHVPASLGMNNHSLLHGTRCDTLRDMQGAQGASTSNKRARPKPKERDASVSFAPDSGSVQGGEEGRLSIPIMCMD